MRTLTLEQLRTANAAGGVSGVTLKAQNGDFYVRVETRGGEAVLTKARSAEPRRFGNPLQALGLLRRLGITVGSFDVTQWHPGQKRTTHVRPDRSAALKRAHEAVTHDQWFRAQVREAIAEADDPNTEWVSHDEARRDMQRQRELIEARRKRIG